MAAASGARHAHTQFLQGQFDGADQRLHVAFGQTADRADAEQVHLADFAWINDKTFVAKAAVEPLENESGIIRVMKGGDDIALVFRRQIRLEAQTAHAGHEHFVVVLIPPTPASHATFLLQFLERLFKRQQDMRRRGEAELPAFLKPFELPKQIQTYRARPSLAGKEQGPATQHNTETGDAFDAFVRTRDQEIDPHLLEINRDRPEAAHGIDDEDA